MSSPDEEETASLCSQLEEVIKCAICWELPTSPKVLPCQHSFCLRCLYPSYLSDLQERHHSRDRIQCPLCRQVFPVPKKGVGSLPADHRTCAVTDIVLKRRHLQGKKVCQVCKVIGKYTTANYFCLSCGTLLCSTCNTSHTENVLYAKHIQVELFIPDSSNLYCADHPKENIQYFCGDCERTICKACLHTKHATHRLTKFVRSADADASLASNLRRFVADKQEEVIKHRQEIRNFQMRNLEDKQKLKNELDEVRREMLKLQKREEELTRRLGMHDEIEERLHEMDETMTSSLGRLDQLDDVITSATRPLRQYPDLTVSEMSVQSLQRAFTSIPLPLHDVDLMTRRYLSMVDGYDGAVDAGDVDGAHDFADVDEAAINGRVRVLWRRDVRLYDVQFLADGSRRMICTDQRRQWRLLAVDFDGDDVDLPPSLERFSDCQCRLAVNAVTGSVCLTHKKKADGWTLPFSVVHPDGRTEGGTIRTSIEQNSLCAVLVTRYHDVLFPFMGFDFPPRSTSLRCHSVGGAYRWYRDTSVGTGAGQLVSPHYATVDVLDRIIISDHYGGKISIYDNMGRHLVSFPRIKVPDDLKEASVDLELPKPAGVCVNSKGYIYVAFPTHDVISLFTPNGQFLRHVVVTKGKARGLSIYDDRYLAVTTFENGLWLYDLEPEVAVRPEVETEKGEDKMAGDEAQSEGEKTKAETVSVEDEPCLDSVAEQRTATPDTVTTEGATIGGDEKSRDNESRDRPSEDCATKPDTVSPDDVSERDVTQTDGSATVDTVKGDTVTNQDSVDSTNDDDDDASITTSDDVSDVIFTDDSADQADCVDGASDVDGAQGATCELKSDPD